MAKGAYIGVGGTARKIKNGYVGVNGVARKIRKAYIGIGGVARPFWGYGKLTYYGRVTGAMQATHQRGACGTVGSYGVFISGDGDATVEAVNMNLVMSIAASLPDGLRFLKAASNGAYVIAGGGQGYFNYSSYEAATSAVYAYNASLTQTVPSAMQVKRVLHACAAIGDYVIFAGGKDVRAATTGTNSDTVTAYNKSLTRSIPAALPAAANYLSAASNAGYAIFCGGQNIAALHSGATAYNPSLTKSNAPAMPAALRSMCGISSPKRAAFIGGNPYTDANGDNVKTVTTYNASLTRSVQTDAVLNYPDDSSIGTYIDGYIIFQVPSSNYPQGGGHTVYSYDDSMTLSTLDDMSYSHMYGCSTTVGKYALFAGGGWSGTSSSNTNRVVEAYTTI